MSSGPTRQKHMQQCIMLYRHTWRCDGLQQLLPWRWYFIVSLSTVIGGLTVWLRIILVPLYSLKLYLTSAISKSCGNYNLFQWMQIHHLIRVCVCVCPILSLCSLKLECEKLASEKTEMQRHYIMVSPIRSLTEPRGDLSVRLCHSGMFQKTPTGSCKGITAAGVVSALLISWIDAAQCLSFRNRSSVFPLYFSFLCSCNLFFPLWKLWASQFTYKNFRISNSGMQLCKPTPNLQNITPHTLYVAGSYLSEHPVPPLSSSTRFSVSSFSLWFLRCTNSLSGLGGGASVRLKAHMNRKPSSVVQNPHRDDQNTICTIC